MKTKIVFIGDFKDSATTQLLVDFVEKYEQFYDISVTGYNFTYIEKDERLAGRITLCGMNSSQHMYDKFVAEYVVITTPAPRFVRVKNSQKIIYILSELDERTFAGSIGDISQIVTDNELFFERFAKSFPNMKIALCCGSTDHEKAQSVLNEIAIRNDSAKEIKRFLLVTDKTNHDVTRDHFGVGSYLAKLSESGTNDVIALSIGGGIGCFSGSITFSNLAVTSSVLKEFDGTIVFDSDRIEVFFDSYVESNGITLKAMDRCKLPELKLFSLAEGVEHASLVLEDESLSAYQKYRQLIDRLYQANSCDRVKVSIIICRYNTPLELLARAVRSALHCGHRNVEVIVVDDGSDDAIGEELSEMIDDKRLVYYYKENEGPGYSRNFGVKKATGEFVFYLDSDDTVHPTGMTCLVAHALYYKLDMVIGKRLLCDERGVPLSESFGSLAGESFACYYSPPEFAGVYSDVMINNLLIRREALFENDIWFSRGLYEDVEYSAKLYSTLKEYHYVSVVIHDWYQYSKRETISSTVSSDNMRERIQKEESAWSYVPEKVKSSRIKTVLQVNFDLYLSNYYQMPEQERVVVWDLLREFVEGKKNYIDCNTYPEKTKELTRALLDGNAYYFEYVINRYFTSKGIDDTPADNYIVFTHYHLYVACLYAIHSQRKSRLFVLQSYATFDTNLIFRLRSTGLFESVTTFIYGTTVGDLFEELKQRPGEEDIVIPKYLYGKFAEVFKNCDSKNDIFYLFSDTHPYWYYIERECENIIKLEDAYDSFDREIKTFEMKGIWAGIQEYEGLYYPKMYFRSDKIKKIIVSKRHDDLPEEYARRIEILDTKQLERDNYDAIKQVMLKIYSVDVSFFTDDATLLLTQPLALFGYCSKEEQKALMKKMVSSYPTSSLLIKPHPADNMDYRYLKGRILPKSVPIEAYNFMDVSIARAITFGSSAIETISFAREKKAFFKLHDFEFNDVADAIKTIVGDVGAKRKTNGVKRKARKAIKLAKSKLNANRIEND